MQINDGRMAEELPGAEFDTSRGCRMTADVVRMTDPSYARPEAGERNLPPATPEESTQAIKYGSAALAYAAQVSALPEGASLSARIEAEVTAMTSPGFITGLANSGLV